MKGLPVLSLPSITPEVCALYGSRSVTSCAKPMSGVVIELPLSSFLLFPPCPTEHVPPCPQVSLFPNPGYGKIL